MAEDVARPGAASHLTPASSPIHARHLFNYQVSVQVLSLV